MNIEQHVTSLELSKRLKELGVQRESAFYWAKWTGEPPCVCYTGGGYTGVMQCSAFLASELGEMLPKEHHELGHLQLWKRSDIMAGNQYAWTAEYHNNGGISAMCDGTLPNAMAQLLIHLIEQGIVDPNLITKQEPKV